MNIKAKKDEAMLKKGESMEMEAMDSKDTAKMSLQVGLLNKEEEQDKEEFGRLNDSFASLGLEKKLEIMHNKANKTQAFP